MFIAQIFVHASDGGLRQCRPELTSAVSALMIMPDVPRMDRLKPITLTVLFLVVGALVWSNVRTSGTSPFRSAGSGGIYSLGHHSYGWPFHGLSEHAWYSLTLSKTASVCYSTYRTYYAAGIIGNIVVATVIIIGTAVALRRWLRLRRAEAKPIRTPVWLVMSTVAAVCAVLLESCGIPWLGSQFHLPIGNPAPTCLRIPIVYGLAVGGLALASYAIELPRFRLRTLFLGTAVVGALLGWFSWHRHALIDAWHREQPAIAAIEKAGGCVHTIQAESHWPDWLIDQKYLLRVNRVDLKGIRSADAVVQQLHTLDGLHRLWLGWSDISDAGLSSIADLDSLTGLELKCTQVTDEGVAKLRKLPHLVDLNLQETNATRASWSPH